MSNFIKRTRLCTLLTASMLLVGCATTSSSPEKSNAPSNTRSSSTVDKKVPRTHTVTPSKKTLKPAPAAMPPAIVDDGDFDVMLEPIRITVPHS